jgi:hypothetical protein
MIASAFGIVAVAGVAALAVDMGYAYVLRTQLQTTVDSAVAAAVIELPDGSAALTRAQNYVQQNMPSSEHGAVLASADFEVGYWNGTSKVFTANATPTNAVRATVRRDASSGNPMRTFFASVMQIDTVDIRAQSIALQHQYTAPCMVALSPTSSEAFNVRSNAFIDLSGCGVTINSNNASALTMWANASFHTGGTCIVGGFDGASTDYSPAPVTSCDPWQDPLASLPLPPTTPAASPTPDANGCNYVNKHINQNESTPMSPVVLTPGVYCGGIYVESNNNGMTMQPGTYVIKDGPFHLDANTDISGTGILIYLTGTGAVLDFDSNAVVTLVGPSSGTYAGILIYQNPAYGGTHRINSNSNKLFEGVIYLPSGDVLVDSNGVIASTAPCTMLIANTFQFDSNAGITGVFDLNPNTTTCSIPIPEGLQSTTTSALVK